MGKAAIVAAGAWSGDLVMAAAAPCSPATDWQAAIRPRKGHLLELPAGVAPRVTHGLMEIEYAKVRQVINVFMKSIGRQKEKRVSARKRSQSMHLADMHANHVSIPPFIHQPAWAL